MDYSQTVKYIHSLGFFSHKPSLERIKMCLEKLGNPQNDFDSIHIAGTNGKGSVCAMISSVFSCAGYKVGRFVSPYIVDFNERIQIDGKSIPDGQLCALAQQIIDTGVSLSEFEFITAMGFLYFAQNNVDIAVVETGLGGRFDATNALSRKAVAVITRIGLDHMAVLGDTVEKIANEKCGIITSENAVASHGQPKAAMDIIKSCSKNLTVPDIENAEILSCDIFGNQFIFEGERYETSLFGEYQIENALTVIKAIEQSGYEISRDDIKEGLKQAFIPARAEVVNREPLIIIDGAHNADGAKELHKIIKKFDKATAVFGAMADKQIEDVIKQTFPLLKSVIVTKADFSPRAANTTDIAKIGKAYCDDILVENDFRSAIKKAIERAGGNPIFVFGSLYLAANIRKLFK